MNIGGRIEILVHFMHVHLQKNIFKNRRNRSRHLRKIVHTVFKINVLNKNALKIGIFCVVQGKSLIIFSHNFYPQNFA